MGFGGGDGHFGWIEDGVVVIVVVPANFGELKGSLGLVVLEEIGGSVGGVHGLTVDIVAMEDG